METEQENWYVYEGGVRDTGASSLDDDASYDGVAINAGEASYLKQIHESFR